MAHGRGWSGPRRSVLPQWNRRRPPHHRLLHRHLPFHLPLPLPSPHPHHPQSLALLPGQRLTRTVRSCEPAAPVPKTWTRAFPAQTLRPPRCSHRPPSNLKPPLGQHGLTCKQACCPSSAAPPLHLVHLLHLLDGPQDQCRPPCPSQAHQSRQHLLHQNHIQLQLCVSRLRELLLHLNCRKIVTSNFPKTIIAPFAHDLIRIEESGCSRARSGRSLETKEVLGFFANGRRSDSENPSRDHI